MKRDGLYIVHDPAEDPPWVINPNRDPAAYAICSLVCDPTADLALDYPVYNERWQTTSPVVYGEDKFKLLDVVPFFHKSFIMKYDQDGIPTKEWLWDLNRKQWVACGA